MALAFYFAPPSKMTAQQYDDSIARLKAAGASHPKGRIYHSAFGPPDNIMVFDIWTSQADFEAFGATLMPILQSLGIAPVTPDVMPVHNTIVPPAPRAAAKKAPAKKKSAPKKKAKAKSAPRKKAKKR